MAAFALQSAKAQSTYYWDNNSTTAGFGTAGGTWLAPTPGGTTGWSMDSTGASTIGSITTGTTDALNFGTSSVGLATGTIAVTGPVSANSITFGSASGAIILGTAGQTITLGGTTPTITVNNTASTISSILSSTTAGATISGTGTLTLSGANNFGTVAGGSPGLTINSGATVKLGVTGALGVNGGSMTLNGTLDLAGFTSGSQTAIFGSGAVVNTGGAATLQFGNASGTFNGSITQTSGVISVQKQSGGTQTFTSTAMNFTGGVDIANGGISVATLANSGAGSFGTGDIRMGNANVTASFTYAGSTNANASSRNINIYGATTGNGAIIDSSGTGTLTLGGAFVSQTATTAGVAKTLTLQGSNTGDNTMSGVISNTGGVGDSDNVLAVTKTGTGTWVLSNTNTYTGITTISGGTLKVASESNLGANPAAFAAGQLTLSGGTLQTTTTFAIDDANRGITLSGTASKISPDAGTTLTLANVIAGTGALTKIGNGTAVMSATNTYSGATTVSAGTLKLDYGTPATDTSKLSNTAALTLGGGTLELSGGTHTETVLSTTLTAGTSSNVTRTNSGTGVLQMNAITPSTGATVNFSANNIATTDTLNSGAGILGPWATVGGTDLATNSTNTADGLIIAYTGYSDVARLTSTTPGSITSGSNSNIRIIESSGSPANITLGSATTNVSSILQSAVGGTSAATIDPSAGQTLQTSTVMVATGAGGLTIGTTANDGTLTAATSGGALNLLNYSTNALTVNSTIANNSTASSLTKAGTGTVTLSGTNTYTGATNVNEGRLVAGSTAAFGSNSAVSVLNGATMELDGFSNSIGSLSGEGTVENASATAATLTTGGLATSTTFSGVIQDGTGGGVLSLTKLGAGTQTLTGANTYTGNTTISVGTLQLGSGGTTGSLSPSSAISVSSGATFAVNQTDSVLQGIDFSSAAITGAGNFTQAGSGTTILTAANAYTGNTTISAGTLQLGNGTSTGALSTSSPISVSAGATFAVNQTDTVTQGTDFSTAAITGAGSLKQMGTGTTVLTAVNSYTGTTTVTGGSLQVGSAGVGTTGTGAVTVQTGSTIFGTGTIKGSSFTAQSGATVQAGDGMAQGNYGTLTFTPVSGSGSFDFQSGSTTILGLNLSGTSDLLNFVGTGSNTLLFSGNLTVGPASLTPTTTAVFNLLDWASLASAPTFASRYTYAGLVTGNGDEAAGLDLPNISGSGYFWDISQFKTNGTIAIVVPEPSRALLMMLGLVGFVTRRRRR